MNPILVTAKEIENQLIADRRYLHQNPEIGFDLPLTATYVKTRLKEMGYEVQDICECGFVAKDNFHGAQRTNLENEVAVLTLHLMAGFAKSPEVRCWVRTRRGCLCASLLVMRASLFKNVRPLLNHH